MVRLASFVLLVAILVPASALGEQVVVASNALYLVDTEQGDVREIAELGRFVKDLAVDAAGNATYAATSGGILEVDLLTGETVRAFGDGPARSVELDDASGHLYGLFTRGADPPELRVFSLEDGSLLRSAPLPASTKMLGWDASVSAVIGLEHGARALHLYDATTAAQEAEIALPRRVTQKPGGGTLFPDVLVHGQSGLIIVPELGPEAGIWVLRPQAEPEWLALGHEAHFRGGAISTDARYVYLSALDHVAKVDLIEKREIAWVGLDVVHQQLALSGDGSALFLTVPVDGQSGALSVLSADTLEPVRRIPVENASPFALAVVPE